MITRVDRIQHHLNKPIPDIVSYLAPLIRARIQEARTVTAGLEDRYLKNFTSPDSAEYNQYVKLASPDITLRNRDILVAGLLEAQAISRTDDLLHKRTYNGGFSILHRFMEHSEDLSAADFQLIAKLFTHARMLLEKENRKLPNPRDPDDVITEVHRFETEKLLQATSKEGAPFGEINTYPLDFLSPREARTFQEAPLALDPATRQAMIERMIREKRPTTADDKEAATQRISAIRDAMQNRMSLLDAAAKCLHDISPLPLSAQPLRKPRTR